MLLTILAPEPASRQVHGAQWGVGQKRQAGRVESGAPAALMRSNSSQTESPDAPPSVLATLTATACVVSPWELPVPKRASHDYWKALKQTAWDLELTGPRCPWINDFQSEVRWVRRNWRDSHGFPPLSDSQRLPPHSLIKQLLGFNAAYRQFLEMRREVRRHEWDELSEALSETELLRQVWQAAADAACQDHIWICRRRALSRVRDLVGEKAYDAGELPPCVPLWRFHEASIR